MTRRLIVSYVAITVLVLILLEVPFALFFADRELDRLTADVERDATVIATIYEDDLENQAPLDPLPAQRYQARTGARVVIVDERGISLVDTEREVPRDFSTRPEISEALGGQRSVGTRPSETLGTDLLFVAIPVASGGTIHGALRLTLDTAEVDAQVQRFWLGLAAIAVVVLAAVSLAGWIIARSVTQPLRELTASARRFGRGDLSVEPGGGQGPPEVRELAETMDKMAAQLDATIEQQKAFVADASHQLRTPLTGLRLQLENLQAELDDPTNAARLEGAIGEIERLSTLVADLLQLARTDRHPSPERVELGRITTERVDTWTAAAEVAGIELDLDVSDRSIEVMAVPGAIEQILDNVLDNAISLAPAGTRVIVSAHRGSTHHRLSIADRGPGLDSDGKQRAARRFWRGEGQRPGSGLGLAIVESLVLASGGELSFEDTPGGGLTVVVALPATVAPT